MTVGAVPKEELSGSLPPPVVGRGGSKTRPYGRCAIIFAFLDRPFGTAPLVISGRFQFYETTPDGNNLTFIHPMAYGHIAQMPYREIA
jgi:hypothetical protein